MTHRNAAIVAGCSGSCQPISTEGYARERNGGDVHGLMMDVPLLVSAILEHAEAVYGRQELVTRTVAGGIHRYGYADAAARARRLAGALRAAGLAAGDRV